VNADDPPYLQMVRWGPTHVPGSLTRQQLAEQYARKTGRDLSQIVFYYVFALFKVAVIIQQIYYRYFHGLTKDQRFASMGEVTKMLLVVAVRAIENNHI
jgi:aminoglycoside phosphotransferase (APT) family kinase protein